MSGKTTGQDPPFVPDLAGQSPQTIPPGLEMQYKVKQFPPTTIPPATITPDGHPQPIKLPKTGITMTDE